MDAQLPRAARLVAGSAEPTFLVDPETGQPVVFASPAATTPGTANGITLFDVDLTGVQTALVHIFGTWVATVTFEYTADGTNWFSATGYRVETGASAAIVSTNGNVALAFAGIARRLRARVTAYTSGTVSSAVFLTDVPAVSMANLQTATVLLGAGTNLAGKFNINGATSGGCTSARVLTASGVIKAAAGQLYAYDLLNTNAAARYLQIYAKATAGVPGTDTPVRTIPLAAGESKAWENTTGSLVATGISYAITSDPAGTTIAAAGDIVGTVDYF